MDQCDPLQERVSTEAPTPDPALDRIVKLAASLFDTPIAAIFLSVDNSIQCKASIGLESTESLEKSAICTDITDHGAALVIEDTSTNQRFQNDPAVASSPHIRFCAGIPLNTSDGRPAGALILADTQARQALSAAEIESLKGFAALATDVLALREASQAPSHPPTQGSAFLASMSHDIRTPMNGVLGMAELLLTADDLSDRHRRRVEIIKRSGTTLLAMIDHLIELSKIDSEASALNSSPLDLRKFVRDVYSRVQSMDFGKNIEFDLVDALDDHHSVSGDAEYLERLFLTFLQVAADFANEPLLRIDVSAEPRPSQRIQIRFSIELSTNDTKGLRGDLASLENGEHFAPDNLENVRNLMICRNLVKSIGGRLEVDYRTDELSMFLMDFSLDSNSVTDRETYVNKDLQTPRPAIDPPGKANTVRDVLVAEDDPDMALLIEDLLDEAGYCATLAPDGASALEFIGQRSFDIVLMDGRLPDMTGFEATEAIRKLPDERGNIPIIALTGEALAGDRERYLSAGMDDYIAKPVSYATLVDTIERCHGERR